MKKIFSRVVNLSAVAVILMGAAQAIVLNMLLPASASAFAGGNGTTNYPYRITNCAQLQNIQSEPDANYAIMNDLFDCTAWTPINGFTGTLDGRNHQVYNIAINQPSSDYLGMFSSIGVGGTVKNMILGNMHITGRSAIGGLAGGTSSGTIITNVTAYATINAESLVGGLVGTMNGTTEISKSISGGTITVTGSRVGGMVGNMDAGSIADSVANNTINSGEASGLVGGLVGWQYSDTSITRSYAKATIHGGSNVGGLIGTMFNPGSGAAPQLSHSFTVSTLDNSPSNFGGLVGWSYGAGSITDSFFDATTTGTTNCNNIGAAVGCSAVNADGTDGNHFKNTSSIAPFTDGSWDFTNVWQVTGEYPYPRYATPDTLLDLPAADAPTDLSITPNATSIELGWVAPEPNEGGEASDYIIEYKISSGSTWTVFSDGTSASTNATITGLIPDTDYDVRVSAVNGGGQSTPVSSDTHTTAPTTSISSCEDLQNIKYAPDADYTLSDNIDCSGTTGWNDNGGGGYYGFEPIQDFTGSLNGNDHTINGLYIDRPTLAMLGYSLILAVQIFPTST